MRNKLVFILFFIYLCVQAQASDIEFQVLKLPEKVNPGSQYTLFFKLKNNRDKPAVFFSRLKLPETWSIVTQKKLRSIKAGGYSNFFYTISIPKNTLAGKDKIQLSIRNSHKKKIINRSFEIEVKRVHEIEISAIRKPTFAIGDDEFEIEYLIKNLGNGVEKLIPSSKTGIIPESPFSLAPETSINLIVTQSALPRNTTTPYDFFPDLSLYLAERDSIIKKFTDIKIYPRTGKSDPYFRFPIEAGIFYNSAIGSDQKGSFQYKLHGDGFLDKLKKHHLEIIADSETNDEFSRIGNFRRTTIRYENEKVKLELMDFYATPSTLMEKSRWGTGAKLEIKDKYLHADIFYITPKFFPEIKKEYGTTTTYNFNDYWKVKGGWVSKNYSSDSLGVSNLFSLSSEYNKVGFQTSLEISESINKKDMGFACYNRLAYKNERLRYQHEFIHADENFQGYYNNSIFLNGSFIYSLSKRIGFNVLGNYNSTNESMDTIASFTAPIFKTFASGFRYKLTTAQSIQLNYAYSQKEDRSIQQKFYFREHAFRMAYYYRKRKANIQLTTSLGKNQNLRFPNEPDQNSFETTAAFRYNIHKRTSLSTSVKYIDNNKFSENNENESDLFFGCNLFFRTKKSFSISLQYKNEYVADEQYQLKSFFGGSINYQINDYHRLSFDANYVGLKDSDDKEVYISAQYNIQVNMPLYKTFNAGHLEGKVIGIGAEKIEGIVIGLNERIAISDKNGYFEFNNLKPGKYFLLPQTSSFGKNDITENPGPFEIDILPKSTSILDFTIIKAAKIQGKVKFNKGKQFGLTANETDGTRVVIELKNENVTLYTITDKNGSFYFGDIRPGEWTINIVDDKLKKKYSISNNYQTIQLGNGENKKISFTMKPIKRKMKLGKKKFKL